MYRACIAIIDATRARFFTYDREVGADGNRDDLFERTDLVNPARRLRPSELFSDSRPGSSRTGHLQYAFDDHRDYHIAQLDAGFARTAMAALRELLDERVPNRVILCASPRMLGHLRIAAEGILPPGLVIEELARDLSKLSAARIREQLTAAHLLPPPPAGAVHAAH
jgi:protein required for attachment to host cells